MPPDFIAALQRRCAGREQPHCRRVITGVRLAAAHALGIMQQALMHAQAHRRLGGEARLTHLPPR